MIPYRPTRIVFLFLFCAGALTVTAQNKKQRKNNNDMAFEKQKLISLEYNWLKAELSLDTAYVSSLMDDSFISINADGISNKQEELSSYYKNISQRLADSIIVDSFRFEDAVVNFYGNTAVVTFIVHTYRKEKGKPAERRTRFYDVWIKRNSSWKAVASQGTKVSE